MSKFPPVAFCELRPYAKTHKYWVEFVEPYQPEQTDQKRKPRKKQGLWLTRVTTILNELNKHSLYQWYALKAVDWMLERVNQGWGRKQLAEARWDAVNAAVKHRDDSAFVGTQVHRAIEEYLQTGFLPDFSETRPEARHAFACWQDWWDQAGIEPVSIEQVVYSLTFGFAGTTDLVGRYGEKTVIVDWKTSTEIHTEHLWQLAAYAMALGEMGLPVPDRGIIVRLPKDFRQASPEWTVAWDSPQQLAQLQLGFSNFCLALLNRPKAVLTVTLRGPGTVTRNADDLFTDEELDRDQDELDKLLDVA